MPTTLKTPSDTQWRWLCDKAGEEFGVIDGEVAYIVHDGHPLPLSDLPHNTDALMRLMKVCFTYYIPRHQNDYCQIMARILCDGWGSRTFEARAEHDDGPTAFCLAACDILAQLAEAEGIK